MKEKLSNLMKAEEGKPRPILLIVLGVVVLAAALYFFVFSKDDGNQEAPQPQGQVEESGGLISKISNLFTFGELPQVQDVPLPTLPQIPEPNVKEDQKILKSVDQLLQARFEMTKVGTENMGRRDPMKPLFGQDVGSYDENKIELTPYDMRDESKNYYQGMGIHDLILDSVENHEDGLPTATFITMGGVLEDVPVGQYVSGIYYLKEVNPKYNYVTIIFKGKEYKLNGQHLIDGNKYYK